MKRLRDTTFPLPHISGGGQPVPLAVTQQRAPYVTLLRDEPVVIARPVWALRLYAARKERADSLLDKPTA